MSRKVSKGGAGTLCALVVGVSLLASMAPAQAHEDSSETAGSTITMDYKPRKEKFVGSVTSGRAKCVGGRTVKLFKARTGKFVAKTTTNSTGGWSIAVDKRSGKYYSKVTAKSYTLDSGVDGYGDAWIHELFCSADKSGVETSF